MKIELKHTIIDGVESYSIWLNKTNLQKSCKTEEEAMSYYNEIKDLVKPLSNSGIKDDLAETILTENI